MADVFVQGQNETICGGVANEGVATFLLATMYHVANGGSVATRLFRNTEMRSYLFLPWRYREMPLQNFVFCADICHKTIYYV